MIANATENSLPPLNGTSDAVEAPKIGELNSIHVAALDGIATVNALFTMSLFIGLSFTVPANVTTVSRKECTEGPGTVRRLITYEVVSFSFFLFSSLLAQSLKLRINLQNSEKDPEKAIIGVGQFKFCLIASTYGSVLGCIFLILSIVDFIRVKLGKLSCGGNSIFAVVALVGLVGLGLLVYSATTTLAFRFVRNKVAKFENRGQAQPTIANAV